MRPSRCRMRRILRSIRSSPRLAMHASSKQQENRIFPRCSHHKRETSLPDQKYTGRPPCFSAFARDHMTMRILVLGSGVIGVTTAWYLRQAGHDVVVVDRQPEPAMETSFANAGQVSPRYAAPWPA